MTQQDKVYGAIFGEAIGDALGHPREFANSKLVLNDLGVKVWSPLVIEDLQPNNMFTDDTQMFCCIGEALLSNPPHIDENQFMEAVSRNFVVWRDNPLGGSHRAPGGSCMAGVRKLGAGVPWLESGGLNAKGDGTAMRSGVVGAYYWQQPDYAFRIGCLTAVNTHYNLEPILGAGIVSYLVAASIKGIEFSTAMGCALKLASEFDDLTVVPHYPQQVRLGPGEADQSPWYAIGHIAAAFCFGNGKRVNISAFNKWNGDDFAVIPAVAAAVFFNARCDTYRNVVLNCVNNTGDCDTTSAIAGTIMGARVGNEGIDEDWRKRIELVDYLEGMAKRVWEASIKVEG